MMTPLLDQRRSPWDRALVLVFAYFLHICPSAAAKLSAAMEHLSKKVYNGTRNCERQTTARTASKERESI